MPNDIILRNVTEDDLPLFFEHQLDPDANHMAAFTRKDPTDRATFMAHWAKILGDDTLINKTILCNGQVVGHVFRYEEDGRAEISYWIGKFYWGHGIATQALLAFLEEVKDRPLYARAVKDNFASLRVLEKCGFTIIDEGKGFANARGAEVEEFLLALSPDEGSKVL
ncbi:GNAT family N-acetyltransferase [soil metagenome]